MDCSISESPVDCLYVHGAGGNNLLWKRTLSYIKGRRRSLAVNLPGHPSGEITCKSVFEYSEAVHGFVQGRSLSPLVVCGHSMGSAIALTLAIEHPEDVSALILIGAGAKLGVDPKILEGLREQPMAAIERLITPMSFSSINLDLGRVARTALSISNLPVFLNDYLACSGFDVRERLKDIRARTLLVCGEQDRMTPPKWTHYLEDNIPDSESFFVRGAGHMVPLEKPESCAGLITSFLSSLSQ